MHHIHHAQRQPALTPDYALRVPAHVQNLLRIGLLGGLGGLALLRVAPRTPRPVASLLLATGVFAAAVARALGAVTDSRARARARQQMMDAMAWCGDERVLDVGCGNGFLLVEAAKHLTTGKATGIDIWLAEAGHQSAQALRRNAQLEGVADRIELQEADARAMPFTDASFDLVVCSLMLHHAGSAASRQQVLREMVRVVKPGGTIALYDMRPFIAGATRHLRAQGLAAVMHSGRFMVTLSARRAPLATAAG
jgi:ubiquinone/menaquinone biosynthesis C-methylase UbiE